MSELLHFAEHPLQEGALVFMGLVYTARLIWFFRWKAGGERQPSTNRNAPPDVARRRGFIYSWGIIGMPWAMESSRTRLFMYSQFVIFHLGVVAAISLSFVIPYLTGLLENVAAVRVFQVVIGLAFLVGAKRILRRMTSPVMRAISSPDDHFSVWLLTVWFFFAFLAVPNSTAGGEWHLLTYFFLTAFFLIYVPFSKISHYLYYPFPRYWFGKSMGYRGVYPLKRGPRPNYGKV